MAELNFTTTDEVYFNGQKIDEVYLGVQKIWPTQPAVHNVRSVVSAKNIGYEQQAIQAQNEYYVDALLQATIPAGTTIMWLADMDTSAMSAIYNMRNMMVTDTLDGDKPWGHNRYHDTLQGDPIPGGGGRAMRTKYGGEWVFPHPLVKGEVFYLTMMEIGMPYFYISIMKITAV